MPSENYRRKLPHRQPKDGVFNICFRLANSLPKDKLVALKEARAKRIEELKKADLDQATLQLVLKNTHELYFGKYDALLDGASVGPTFLKQPAIASIVIDDLWYWHNNQTYKLICYIIMSNHVHLMIYKTQKQLYKILQSIKRHSAKEANVLLDRTGISFWHDESYDNLVRNRADLRIKIQYVLLNSVKAGLVDNWQDFDFVYLNPEFQQYAP